VQIVKRSIILDQIVVLL